MDYLYRVFKVLCLRGELTSNLVEAFPRVLDEVGASNSRADLEDFLSRTLDEARTALGPDAPLDFLNVDLGRNGETSVDIETSWHRLWQAACRAREVSAMASVRCAMIQTMGEERQVELIGRWNEEKLP